MPSCSTVRCSPTSPRPGSDCQGGECRFRCHPGIGTGETSLRKEPQMRGLTPAHCRRRRLGGKPTHRRGNRERRARRRSPSVRRGSSPRIMGADGPTTPRYGSGPRSRLEWQHQAHCPAARRGRFFEIDDEPSGQICPERWAALGAADCWVVGENSASAAGCADSSVRCTRASTPSRKHRSSSTLLGWEGVVAQWAGTDPTNKCALEFAEDAVESQSCPAAFGWVSRRVVMNRWAAVTRVAWWCQPSQERPSK